MNAYDVNKLIEIRPDESCGYAQLWLPWSGKRYRVRADLLTKLLTSKKILTNFFPKGVVRNSEVANWIEKGWLRSLYYLLASRRWILSTADEKFEFDIRSKYIQAYKKTDNFPKYYQGTKEEITLEAPSHQPITPDKLRVLLLTRRTVRGYVNSACGTSGLSSALWKSLEKERINRLNIRDKKIQIIF